jgi:hypothetical protein
MDGIGVFFAGFGVDGRPYWAIVSFGGLTMLETSPFVPRVVYTALLTVGSCNCSWIWPAQIA